MGFDSPGGRPRAEKCGIKSAEFSHIRDATAAEWRLSNPLPRQTVFNPDRLRYISESDGLVNARKTAFSTRAPFFAALLRAMLAAGKAG